MMHRIQSVTPLKNLILSVLFQNGVEKQFDMHDLFSAFPQFREFEANNELFNQVHAEAGGYGIAWNEDLDLDAEDLWEDGTEVCVHETDAVASLAVSLTAARSKAGMTQKQLSEETGICQADISKIERGLANPSLLTLKRLADGIRVKLKIEFISNP